MNITKYKSGRESYDFKISKRHFAEFVGASAKADDKCGNWWLATEDGKQLKLIVEDENG